MIDLGQSSVAIDEIIDVLRRARRGGSGVAVVGAADLRSQESRRKVERANEVRWHRGSGAQ